MASVYKHSRGKTPYFIGVFQGMDGKQRHRSTKLTDKSKSMALAEKWEREAKILRKASGLTNRDLILESFIAATQQAVKGEFTEVVARGILDRILESTGQSPLRSKTTKEFLQFWAESKSKSKAPGTATRYAKTVESFLEFIEKKAALSLAAITPKEIEGFRDLQIEQGKAETTANMEVKTLRIAFNHARRQGLVLTNPADAVDLLDADGQVRNPFSLEQLTAILTKAEDEWRGLILVGVCTGLRIGDASRLNWENIDLTRKTIRIQTGKRVRGKPRKTLETVILPDLEEYLLSTPSGNSPSVPLFPKLTRIRPGGCKGLSQLFQNIMHTAGVYAQEDGRKITGKGRRFNDLTFHSLRHTYVSFMANKGVAKEIRKKLAGHTTDVHDRYTHIELETLRHALKDFPSVTNNQRGET